MTTGQKYLVNEGPTPSQLSQCVELTRMALRWHVTARRHLQETDENKYPFEKPAKFKRDPLWSGLGCAAAAMG